MASYVGCGAPSVCDVRDLAVGYADNAVPPLMRGYVTAYRDEDALQTALMLRQELDVAVPLVVALSRRRGVTRLINTVSTGSALMGLDLLPTLQRTCTTELLQSGSFHAIAVAIHRRWCAEQLGAGKPAPSWEELDESRKGTSVGAVVGSMVAAAIGGEQLVGNFGGLANLGR